MNRLTQTLLLLQSISVYKQTLEEKVMTRDIFAHPPTDFILVK